MVETKKVIEYLNIRRKKLRLAKEQLSFRDKVSPSTIAWLNVKISAKLEEVKGMIERLEAIGIDEMIVIAQDDYDKKKEKKDKEVRKWQK